MADCGATSQQHEYTEITRTSSITYYDGPVVECIPSIEEGQSLNTVLTAILNKICSLSAPVDDECNCTTRDVTIGAGFEAFNDDCLSNTYTSESTLSALLQDIVNTLCSLSTAFYGLAVPENITELELGLTQYTEFNALDCFSGYADNTTLYELLLDMATLICQNTGDITEEGTSHKRMLMDYMDGGNVVPSDNSGVLTTSGASLIVNVNNPTLSKSVYIVAGAIIIKNAEDITLPANSDSYIDIDSTGTYQVTSVSIGAPAPATIGVRLWRATTNGVGVVATSDSRFKAQYYHTTGDHLADNVIIERHITDGEVTVNKLSDIIIGGVFGADDFIKVAYNNKGLITNVSSGIVIGPLSPGEILQYDGTNWTNVPYVTVAMPSATEEGSTIYWDGLAYQESLFLKIGSFIHVGFEAIEEPSEAVHFNEQIAFAINDRSYSALAVAGGSLTGSTTYYYRLAFIDDAGNRTSLGAEISVTTTPSDKQVELSITPPKGAKSVRLYRSTTTGVYTEYIPIADLTTLIVDDGTISPVADVPTDSESSISMSVGPEGLFFGFTPVDSHMLGAKNKVTGLSVGIEVYVEQSNETLDVFGAKFGATTDTSGRNTGLFAEASNGVENLAGHFDGDLLVGEGITKNSNAALEVQSTSKGLLLPRMTTAQRIAIPAGAGDGGLMVFDTDLTAFYGWDGTTWNTL